MTLVDINGTTVDPDRVTIVNGMYDSSFHHLRSLLIEQGILNSRNDIQAMIDGGYVQIELKPVPEISITHYATITILPKGYEVLKNARTRCHAD